jgi:hypothetical protein
MSTITTMTVALSLVITGDSKGKRNEWTRIGRSAAMTGVQRRAIHCFSDNAGCCDARRRASQSIAAQAAEGVI